MREEEPGENANDDDDDDDDDEIDDDVDVVEDEDDDDDDGDAMMDGGDERQPPAIQAYIPEYLRRVVFPYHGDFCQTPLFHPRLIAQLMAEGFLPIAAPYPGVLLPKLHEERSVVHPLSSGLHVSKSTRKKSGRFALTVNRDFDAVVSGCQDQHEHCWLFPPLVAAFRIIHAATTMNAATNDHDHDRARNRNRHNNASTTTKATGAAAAAASSPGVETTVFQENVTTTSSGARTITTKAPATVRMYSIEVWSRDNPRNGEIDHDHDKHHDDHSHNNHDHDDHHNHNQHHHDHDNDDSIENRSQRKNKNHNKHNSNADASTHASEWTLVAGELGYTVGSIYTSLTGFSRQDSAGSVQLAALGRLLCQSGFTCWDLGMDMIYKRSLGAKLMKRSDYVSLVHSVRTDHRHVVLRSPPPPPVRPRTGGHTKEEEEQPQPPIINARNIIDGDWMTIAEKEGGGGEGGATKGGAGGRAAASKKSAEENQGSMAPTTIPTPTATATATRMEHCRPKQSQQNRRRTNKKKGKNKNKKKHQH